MQCLHLMKEKKDWTIIIARQEPVFTMHVLVSIRHIHGISLVGPSSAAGARLWQLFRKIISILFKKVLCWMNQMYNLTYSSRLPMCNVVLAVRPEPHSKHWKLSQHRWYYVETYMSNRLWLVAETQVGVAPMRYSFRALFCIEVRLLSPFSSV